MTIEVVEMEPARHHLWAEAVALFRDVQHDCHDRFLSDPSTVAFVAHDEGQIVGWAWGYRMLRADGHSMLLLYEIEVIESERRKGVGGTLLDAFLDVGRREGHLKMWLLSDVNNQEAISLYEVTGARRSETADVAFWWQFD